VTPAFSILRLIESIFGVLLTFGRLTLGLIKPSLSLAQASPNVRLTTAAHLRHARANDSTVCEGRAQARPRAVRYGLLGCRLNRE
jgi:hypothetical protein